MNTPICDFVKKYVSSDAVRLHMPGHKGVSYLGAESLDITEIDGADVLYHANGIIKESEQNAADLFGTAATLYSAEGSSLCIRAMLYLVRLYAVANGKTPRIAAGRNAHKSFMTAAALVDIEIDWIYDEREKLLSCSVTADALEAYLQDNQPTAVYVTSPDYLGHRLDIAALAAVCHRHNVLLLVDNAHGAYLRFLPQDLHPSTLGADMCCDSAHKTLPVLTGGAYLHIAKTAPSLLCERANDGLSLFASTSPSYLILQSLDAANAYLSNGYRERLAQFVQAVQRVRNTLSAAGFLFVGNEPLKMTLCPKTYGYTGEQLSEQLLQAGIVSEFADPDHITWMLTPEVGEEGLERLETALLSLPEREPITVTPPLLLPAKRVMSPRQALFANSERLPLADCIGRVLAAPAVSCPPAVPIVVCGEEISADAAQVFAYYGVENCRVVAE